MFSSDGGFTSVGWPATGLLLVLLTLAGVPCSAPAQATGQSAGAGRLKVTVPAGLLHDRYWLYVDGKLVAAPPLAASYTWHVGYGPDDPDGHYEVHGVGGLIATVDGNGRVLSANSKLANASHFYQTFYRTVDLPLRAGRHRVDLLVLSAEQADSGFPFAMTVKQLDLRVGQVAQYSPELPNGLSWAAAAWIELEACPDGPPADLADTRSAASRWYLSVPMVRALYEAEPSYVSGGERVVRLDLPAGLGGPREFDDGQIQKIVDVIGHLVDGKIPSSEEIAKCQVAYPQLAEGLAAYRTLAEGIESDLNSFRVVAAEPDVAADRAYGRGNSYFDHKEYRSAITMYTQAIRTAPHAQAAFVARGNAYLALMSYDSAAADYDRAVAADPTYSMAFFAMGTLRWFLGDLDAAVRNYHRAVELAPDNSYYYVRLATVLSEQKNDAEAYAAYEQAYRQDPRREWALSGWLGALASKGNFNDLLQVSQRLFATGVRAVPVRYYGGLAYLKLKQYQAAIPEFQAAIAPNPNGIDPRAFSFLAEAERAVGDATGCRQAVNEYFGRIGRTGDLSFCEHASSQ